MVTPVIGKAVVAPVLHHGLGYGHLGYGYGLGYGHLGYGLGLGYGYGGLHHGGLLHGGIIG